jgi:catechol 2,3-dioxygenase-like lactoylglutathione lyase family enzyme
VTDLGILASTLGPGAKAFHAGYVVPDLDEAIATMTAVLGVPFTAPMDVPAMQLHTPDGVREVCFRMSYSTRPAHVELIATQPGTLWDFDDHQRGHHIGIWADDVAAESRRLEALGLPAVWWADDGNGGRTFGYHQTPYGFYLELVSTAAQAFYPDWFRSADPTL